MIAKEQIRSLYCIKRNLRDNKKILTFDRCDSMIGLYVIRFAGSCSIFDLELTEMERRFII